MRMLHKSYLSTNTSLGDSGAKVHCMIDVAIAAKPEQPRMSVASAIFHFLHTSCPNPVF